MKEISKRTKADLKEGEMVVVCKGGSKIPCVVRRCGDVPCMLCVLWNQGYPECDKWYGYIVEEYPGRTSSAAFVPLEEVVE